MFVVMLDVAPAFFSNKHRWLWVPDRASLVRDDRVYRCPKIAEPTRMCVAPNWIAVAKSALMPIDRLFSPLRAAIFAVSAKCGAGASSTGGMHIRPEIGKPYFSRQL